MVQNFLMFAVRFPVWIPVLLTSMARKPRWFEGRELPHVDPSTAREDGDKLGKEGNYPCRWNQFTLESEVYSNHLRPALDTSRCEAPSPWCNHTRLLWRNRLKLCDFGLWLGWSWIIQISNTIRKGVEWGNGWKLASIHCSFLVGNLRSCTEVHYFWTWSLGLGRIGGAGLQAFGLILLIHSVTTLRQAFKRTRRFSDSHCPRSSNKKLGLGALRVLLLFQPSSQPFQTSLLQFFHGSLDYSWLRIKTPLAELFVVWKWKILEGFHLAIRTEGIREDLTNEQHLSEILQGTQGFGVVVHEFTTWLKQKWVLAPSIGWARWYPKQPTDIRIHTSTYTAYSTFWKAYVRTFLFYSPICSKFFSSVNGKRHFLKSVPDTVTQQP